MPLVCDVVAVIFVSPAVDCYANAMPLTFNPRTLVPRACRTKKNTNNTDWIEIEKNSMYVCVCLYIYALSIHHVENRNENMGGYGTLE